MSCKASNLPEREEDMCTKSSNDYFEDDEDIEDFMASYSTQPSTKRTTDFDDNDDDHIEDYMQSYSTPVKVDYRDVEYDVNDAIEDLWDDEDSFEEFLNEINCISPKTSNDASKLNLLDGKEINDIGTGSYFSDDEVLDYMSCYNTQIFTNQNVQVSLDIKSLTDNPLNVELNPQSNSDSNGRKTEPSFEKTLLPNGLEPEPSLKKPCLTSRQKLEPSFKKPCFASGLKTEPNFKKLCLTSGQKPEPNFKKPCFISGHKTEANFKKPCSISVQKIEPSFKKPCFTSGQKAEASFKKPCSISGQKIEPSFKKPCFISGQKTEANFKKTCSISGQKSEPSFKKPCFTSGQKAEVSFKKPYTSVWSENFRKQHIEGKHRPNKPVNTVADFQSGGGFKILRKSGSSKNSVVPGRHEGQIKVVTKEAIPYRETGFKRRGQTGSKIFMVTAKKLNGVDSVVPEHLDGAATWENGKIRVGREIYSQCTQQTQRYMC